MALSRVFKLVEENYCRRVRVLNNSGTDVLEGDGFSVVAGTITVLANNSRDGLYGVWCEDVAVGAEGAAWVEGVFDVPVAAAGVGTNFAINDPVYMAGVATVDTGTKLDVAIGKVVGPEPADGAASVRVLIQSQSKTITTHA